MIHPKQRGIETGLTFDMLTSTNCVQVKASFLAINILSVVILYPFQDLARHKMSVTSLSVIWCCNVLNDVQLYQKILVQQSVVCVLFVFFSQLNLVSPKCLFIYSDKYIPRELLFFCQRSRGRVRRGEAYFSGRYYPKLHKQFVALSVATPAGEIPGTRWRALTRSRG